MKLLSLLCWLALVPAALAATPTNVDFPLGPIGGTFRIATGDHYLRITAVESGAPGDLAGLRVGDYVYGSDGVPFDPTGSDFQGATRQLGWAIGQAQATDGILALNVLRSATGLVAINVDLGTAGGFSPAYPLNSPTFNTVATASLDRLNQSLTDSNHIGYTTGWAGLSLLASSHWADTTGPHPYRIGIDKTYAYYKGLIEDAQYAPVEDKLFDGTDNPHADGSTATYLENWWLGLGTMFLAEYYTKTLQDPPTAQNIVDLALLQNAAEKLANRIQWWRQPQTRSDGQYYSSLRPGVIGHSNVNGDYMHYTSGGGINIVSVHVSGGLAMAKNAGVDMSARPADGWTFGYSPLLFDADADNDPAGESLPSGLNFDPATNTVQVRTGVDADGDDIFAPMQFLPTSASHPDIPNIDDFPAQQPSLDDKLNMVWDFYKRSQSTTTGHIVYAIGTAGIGDSGGRTPGAMFTAQQMQASNGAAFDGVDETRFDLLKEYHSKQYDRHLNAHVTNIQGPAFFHLAASSMGTRERQHFLDNWRFLYQLSRNNDDSTTFFRGRSYGGSGESSHADEIYFALANGVAAGGLELVEGYDTTNKRLVDFSKVPHLEWKDLARRTITTTSLNIPLDLEVTDGSGAPTAAYSAAWTTASGATFSASDTLDTTITLPRAGVFDVTLTVTSGAISTTEDLRITALPEIDDTLYAAGKADYAVYKGIAGSAVRDLTSDASFPASPDETRQLDELRGDASGNSYGATLITTIIPAETGTYRFYIASDDQSTLLFNSAGANASGAVEIASVGSWTASQQWDKFPSQRSAEIELVAGQHYYLEGRMKENGGADVFEIAWQTPSNAAIEIISAPFLAAPINSAAAAFVSQPSDISASLGDTIALTAAVIGPEPHIFQWQKDGQNYGEPSLSPTLEIGNVSAYAEGTWQLIYTSKNTILTSDEIDLDLTDVGNIANGGLWQEIYNNVSGGTIEDLLGSANFPTAPDASGPITTTYQPTRGDSYGQRWTGWIIPNETANYRFYAAADDQIQINLSESEYACHAEQILRNNAYSGYRNYDQRSPSAWIQLVAGQRYFIEVLHTEGGGGDHAAITWQKEGDPTPTDGSEGIPAANLQYRSGGADPLQACPPLARRDTTTAVAGRMIEIPLLANDFVKAPSTITVASITQPNIGSATLATDAQTLRFFAPAASTGDALLTYTIVDSTGLTSTGEVEIAISSLSAGLELHYDFEDTSANTARDVSGNARHGSFTGTPTDAADPLFGNAVNLDASSDTVAVNPAVLDALTTAGTVSYWAKASSYPSHWVTMMLAEDADGDRILRWHYPWSSQAIMDWGDGESYDRVIRYSGIASADLVDTWKHVVLTKDSASGHMRIYVDGQSIATTINKTRDIGSATSFRLGGSGFRGQLGELRIYDRALGDGEITALYQRPTRPAIALTADATMVAENAGTSVTYTISRSGGDHSAALPVQLSISGSATNGSDYSLVAGLVTIPAGASSQTITLAPVDDTVPENTESVAIRVATDPSYDIASADTLLSITNDDAPTMGAMQIDLAAKTVTVQAPAADQEVEWATPQWSSTLEANDWHDLSAQPMRMTGEMQSMPLPAAAQGQTKLFLRWKIE